MKTKKVEDLLTKFDSTKLIPLIINGSGAQFFFWATFAFVLPVYIILFVMLITFDLTYMFWLFTFISLGAISYFISVTKCNKYVKNNPKFASYRGILKLRWWAYSYGSFLREYQFEVIKTEMGHKRLEPDDRIDEIINILEADGTKLLEGNWKPIIILGVVLFPLIGEYVAFRYNLILQKSGADLGRLYNLTTGNEKAAMDIAKLIESTKFDGLGLIVELLPSMILASLFVWLLVFLSEKLLLGKVKNRRDLIKLLRLIKIHR